MRLLSRGLIGVGVLALISAVAGCDYVVIPEAKSTAPPVDAEGVWSAVATDVEETPEGLHVELAIRNDTGDWSAMELAEGASVSLVEGDGNRSVCETAVVETGGTSIPPGFIMRGFTGGTNTDPQIEMLRVECDGPAPGEGAKLSIPYAFTSGESNYYRPEPPETDTLEVDLDTLFPDLAYPIGTETDLAVTRVGEPIEAINKVVLTLTEFTRTDEDIEFSWHTENPTSYQAYVHIGNPPVIGSDGILHGRYRAPHLVNVPITLANETAEWTTSVELPTEAQGLYVLPAVESKQQKNYVSHLIDLAEEGTTP